MPAGQKRYERFFERAKGKYHHNSKRLLLPNDAAKAEYDALDRKSQKDLKNNSSAMRLERKHIGQSSRSIVQDDLNTTKKVLPNVKAWAMQTRNQKRHSDVRGLDMKGGWSKYYDKTRSKTYQKNKHKYNRVDIERPKFPHAYSEYKQMVSNLQKKLASISRKRAAPAAPALAKASKAPKAPKAPAPKRKRVSNRELTSLGYGYS